jgi:maleylacetoacetate isomerase
VTNLVVRQYVKEISDEAHAADWMTRVTLKGLQAYEDVASGWAGRYSVGDELTVADCCLVPAVWNAQRLEIDVAARFPTIARVMKNLEEVPAVKEASYFRQKDCPPELRAKH